MADTGDISLSSSFSKAESGRCKETTGSLAGHLGNELGRRCRGWVSFLVLLLVWSAVSRLALVSAQTLPSPATVARTFAELSGSGLLWPSLGKSLIRIARGFLIGNLLGFALGALMGVSRSAEKLLAPLTDALRQVPIIGWIPLIIVWCGIADLSKITFIAIGAFFPMVVGTFEGIRSVPGGYLEVARVFEYGKCRLLRTIVLPGALPSIVSGIRLSLGASWMLVVWSEINTRSDLGIGDMLWSARETSRMDVVIVCIMVIGAVVFLINDLLGHIESRLQGWKKG
jgi:sulfonate transport system permease protein